MITKTPHNKITRSVLIWQDIIFQEDLKSAVENLEKHCADQDHPCDQIVRYRHKNGSNVWIRFRGLAIRDEFTIILRNIKDKTTAENLIKKIHAMLQEVIHIGEKECSIGSSIGVSIYPDNGKDRKILLKNADLSMYQVKRDGKGNFQFFETRL